MAEEDNDTEHVTTHPKRGLSSGVVVVLIVVALFAGILFAKARSNPTVTQTATTAGSGSGAAAPNGASITSVRNDAGADYEAALKTGKPIYVLSHSLS